MFFEISPFNLNVLIPYLFVSEPSLVSCQQCPQIKKVTANCFFGLIFMMILFLWV